MRARKLLAMGTATVMALSPASAGPALLFDPANGRVLYAEDQDDQWFPASLTKIMTAYVVFAAIRNGELRLDDKVRVSKLAHGQPPSRLGLPVGATITVETAITALIVKSANDVAIMLAETVAGSQQAFVARMNATARFLGMTRTHYVNVNGLPAREQVSTARDLARLTVAVMRDFPAYAHLWAMPEMRMGKKVLRSYNPLLGAYEGADGMKTGFICDSGYNLIASASRDGQRLVAVVLGETTMRGRGQRAADLLEHGFKTVAWKAMFGTESLETLPVAANPKGPVSIREKVVSWICNPPPKKTKRRRSAK